ncbi:hypothetical protein KNP414_06604 [Paenibacillus mucilaginosus KNP414]|uniref:Uncharacterized protein n=1 Tax=Paenibacillus mucilaginosus (strain KNP414) TaxID=1036673 RepID=F8F7A0_PAEMK|nr:hypothetical protein KNP414_06604 [Paenibacillus mucilaginosus KNP414]
MNKLILLPLESHVKKQKSPAAALYSMSAAEPRVFGPS